MYECTPGGVGSHSSPSCTFDALLCILAFFSDLRRSARSSVPFMLAQRLIQGLVGGRVSTEVKAMIDVTKDRTMNNGERKERRGMASMCPQKQRGDARKGGRPAPARGEWTSDEARNAGRKGGEISRGGRGRLVEPAPDVVGTPAEAVGE